MMVCLCSSFFTLFSCCSVVSSLGIGKSGTWSTSSPPSPPASMARSRFARVSLTSRCPFLDMFSLRCHHPWLRGRAVRWGWSQQEVVGTGPVWHGWPWPLLPGAVLQPPLPVPGHQCPVNRHMAWADSRRVRFQRNV